MQTGCEHACLKEYEAAEACFSKATEHRSLLCSTLDGPGPATCQLCEFTVAYFRLLVDRAENAWHLQQRVSRRSEHVRAMHCRITCWLRCAACAASSCLQADLPSSQSSRAYIKWCCKSMHCGLHASRGMSVEGDLAYAACTQALAADLLSTAAEVAQRQAVFDQLLRCHLVDTLVRACLHQGR